MSLKIKFIYIVRTMCNIISLALLTYSDSTITLGCTIMTIKYDIIWYLTEQICYKSIVSTVNKVLAINKANTYDR